jgi:serine/threonine protein kinase
LAGSQGRAANTWQQFTVVACCRPCPPQATQLCDFLLPMLRFDPTKRATAAEMLNHPWLQEKRPASRFRRAMEADDERPARPSPAR